MKVPCLICDRKGKVEKRFPNGVQRVDRGFFSLNTHIVDAATGERVGIPVHIKGLFPYDVMPMVDCQACDGSGWVERPVDISASVEIK